MSTPAGHEGRTDSPGRGRRAVSPLVVAALFVVGTGVLLLLLYPLIRGVLIDLPEHLRQTLWVVFAVGALLVGILVLSMWAHRSDPTGTRERGPLGLPQGSVSAILALTILIIFSTSSTFLYGQIRAGEGTGWESTGVPAEMLDELPPERILSISEQTPATGEQPATYQVRMSAPHGESTDYAKTLLTIFSTLLVAIVGFYFGQGASTKGSIAQKVEDEAAAALTEKRLADTDQ